MTIGDFPAFYKAIHHDRDPFPWQDRLASEIALQGRWPGQIAIPTGCGKTSVLDISVFTLALHVNSSPDKRPPLRTFFVVDRRLVVDDVATHAKRIATALASAESGILKEAADRLRYFGTDRPLRVVTLRGAMYCDENWSDAPNQPLLCVSTVDQIGSRLLFRGYGVSPCRRPIDAALAGTDSLIILDEAHLSTAFSGTLRAVQRFQEPGRWAVEQVAPGLQFVEMSATVRDAGQAFSLGEKDFADPRLLIRLGARKVAELREVGALKEEAAFEAQRLRDDTAAKLIGVVVNTVQAAREIFQRLGGESGGAILLTGRIRPWDRDRLLDRYLSRMRPGRDRKLDEPLFVVATQTVEVGADLDFDALVTEAAPLDSLRQRFGRLDRLGSRRQSGALVLKRKLPRGTKPAVYGEPLLATWDWLNENATTENNRRLIDFGIEALRLLLEQHPSDGLNAETTGAPVMMPGHIDAWIQTSPEPEPDPDVSPFLHGRDALEAADIQIVWRADVEDLQLSEWAGVVAEAPPLSTEALPLPLGMARRWLVSSTSPALADIEGLRDDDTSEEPSTKRLALLWRGPENSVTTVSSLRPGDTVIVRSSEGGADEFGWNPGSGPVTDIGDECANDRARSGGGRLRLRVHRALLKPEDEEIAEILTAILDDGETPEQQDQIRAWARAKTQAGPRKWRPQTYSEHAILFRMDRIAKPDSGDLQASSADETVNFTGPVFLDDHIRHVIDKARHFTGRCGLSAILGEAVSEAARLHDWGKFDPRFQQVLEPAGSSRPLAKGEYSGSYADYLLRAEDAGYPVGTRHELASVAFAQQMLTPDQPARDLILHLIGTHHGYGRPLPRFVPDNPGFCYTEPGGHGITVADVQHLCEFGSGWVDRFCQLNFQYGYWGLSYLEAILRTADWAASREERNKQQMKEVFDA